MIEKREHQRGIQISQLQLSVGLFRSIAGELEEQPEAVAIGCHGLRTSNYAGESAGLPTVWNSPATDMRLKQRIVRILIEEIIADVDDAPRRSCC